VLAPLPPALVAAVVHLPPAPKLGMLLAAQLAAPLFMLAPLSLTLLLAASAFVAEKEARTLEALLYSPATDWELLVGKLLGAVVPALLMGWASFGIYGLVITQATRGIVPWAWFPTPIWWPWMFWDLPAFLTLAAAAMVLVSTRAGTQQAAQQLGGLLGLVATAMVAAQGAGVVRADLAMACWTGAGLWAAALVVLLLARRDFSRHRLVLRL
jgi:ABC-type Na+ efflux pump permease subunit